MTVRTEAEEQIRLHMEMLSPELAALFTRRLLAACHTAPRVEGELEAVLRDLGLATRPQAEAEQ